MKRTTKTRSLQKNNKKRETAKIKLEDINYKNVGLLQKFVSRKFKILPKKYTKLPSKYQRRLAREIKRARQMALLKYTDRH
ncbi:MAG TPA: 30S ribosomal protein S18 [candidate division WWE3 bacterium]|uniref:Small ribosomal subunit protein bS18 n=1 Tax=candidate division WWE3 bacterium TaxID=2053526 RepID=A0A7V5J076_UNCKA|nr:30S ribosomal protein S18 [candidate division WWE3 bacterium]